LFFLCRKKSVGIYDDDDDDDDDLDRPRTT